ncbi:Fe2OG dioxygenase domain-containing protein [Mycena indigotica]|uniref:Fe2OG dioxygenase domain-containing protein n=1 Tax=Mycena indigotica TaxID=2126181 RepID=A0A8H6RX65_9AGAR|nr:Fe2OG dioxygenase domain-containing protein [Mycena indigotica]KAF7288949.1 Fe2OG dioxygenase domain-containing protein [Mycena indigotica]
MPPKTPTAEDHLRVLRDALKQSTPWTSGLLNVRPDELVLFYKHGAGEDDARHLNFNDATEEQLARLAESCQPATFGKGTEDILDESYRKAGKLDCADFAASLDVGTLRLVEAISPDLLDGRDDVEDKSIKAELYKLNVYGPGSFFKAHKDTPRAGDMIGSLVVVLPTAHSGGALTLSHGDSSTSFDSGALLADKPSSIAYAAFFSDVTHAVEEVTSGYRVTLTYNLFLLDAPTSRLVPGRQASAAETACEAALRALMADATFLPAGGLLGFGLQHQYPVPRTPSDPASLEHVTTVLKGADARMQSAAARVGLESVIQLIYRSLEYYARGRDRGGNQVVLGEVIDLEGMWDEGGETSEAVEKAGEVLRTARYSEIGVKPKKNSQPESESAGLEDEKRTAIFWVRRLTRLNRAESAFIAMGNQADLAHSYGDAALLVRFPPSGQRGAE